jgi:drug/metabolite transporter (DMT)-like permease
MQCWPVWNRQVLFVAALDWAMLGERPGRRYLVTLPVVLLGAVMVSGVAGGTSTGPLRDQARPAQADQAQSGSWPPGHVSGPRAAPSMSTTAAPAAISGSRDIR